MIANSVSKLQNECSNDNKFCFNFRITTLHHKASSWTVKEKQNVRLPGGFPPPVITWYENGYSIKDVRRQSKERNLEIKEIVFENRGTYTCTAENLLGRIELSVNVTVEGTSISKFLVCPQNSRILPSFFVMIYCRSQFMISSSYSLLFCSSNKI